MLRKLLVLWWTFFYVGLFTIGGGYAMLPLLEKEVVVKNQWLTHKQLLDVFALGQSTPGIIALNVSTYVGAGQCGLAGAVFSTLGMVTPSLLIISFLAYFIQNISSIPVVMSIFAGVRAVVAGLLIASVYKLGKRSIKNLFSTVILLVGFILLAFFSVSPIFVVLGGGISGVLVYSLTGVGSSEGGDE